MEEIFTSFKSFPFINKGNISDEFNKIDKN